VVARERGFTMMEVMCALGVMTILVTSILVGERAQLRAVTQSFDELAASRAASSRLEQLSAAPASLLTGESAFDVALPGCAGTQHITLREPGLFEVRVVVGGAGRRCELTTLIAVGAKR